jgi:hypothetical protein
VVAVSHSANFDEKANLVNLAALAMNEAFDQRAIVTLPEPEQGATLITAALRAYAAETGSTALCAVPLEAANEVVAVWLLERDAPFTAADCESLETLGLAMAPILQLQRTAEESLLRHGQRAWQRTLRQVTDTSRPGAKLLAITAVLLLAVLAWYPADFRVGARASVEGAVQRVAAAPFQGYIREAPARAGDMVRQGQVLAVLEDKDLQLERCAGSRSSRSRCARSARPWPRRTASRCAWPRPRPTRPARSSTCRAGEAGRVQVTAPFDGIVVRATCRSSSARRWSRARCCSNWRRWTPGA